MRLSKPKINTENKYDGILLWGMFIPLCALMLQLVIYKLMGVERNGTVHSIIMLISAVPMLISAFVWIKRRRNLYIAVSVYAFIAAVFVFNYFVYPENRRYLLYYVSDVFLISMPLFINSMLVKDEIHELNILKKISLFIFVTGILYFLLDMFWRTHEGYSMSYGYYMLIPACFFAYIYFDSNKTGYLFLSIASILPVIIIGSRGPVMAWALYFAALIAISDMRKSRKLLIILAVVFTVIFRDWIFKYLYLIFKSIGINSRTLRLFVEGRISQDSGRGLIQAKCFEMIRENWFVGSGIGADRRVIGTYPHNLFIEIILQFGIIIGGFLLAALICAAIRGFIRADNKKLYFFYFCIGFLPLMVSGTYLTDLTFWLFLGYVFRSRQKCDLSSDETLHVKNSREKQRGI